MAKTTAKTKQKEGLVRKSDPLLMRKGDFLSRTSYMSVLGSNRTHIDVINQDGLEWSIDKNVIAKECFSANQFSQEQKVTRTELVRLFTGAGDAVFTVNFVKQDGGERTLIGYLLTTENEFGRSNVVDLEINEGRQVDHRTLNWLILKNIRYSVK